MPTKVILDTDIGSDIDDAVCLAYLLAQPECDLLGITTVSGEAEKRAAMASALCEVAGKSVPIFPGAEPPLLNKPIQTQAKQAEALSKWPRQTDFPQGEAVEFMRRTIRENPGEVVLLPIGPLTNIALLFSVDPAIPALLKGLVLMSGAFTVNFNWPEWNVKLDPHAAEIVYRSDVVVHRAIGLDVTLQVTMPADEVRRRFEKPLLRPVLDFAEVWFRDADVITFHDPLAAVTIFDERVCQFERGLVEIVLDEGESQGKTLWRPGHPVGKHEVAVQVDAPRFFSHYFDVFE